MATGGTLRWQTSSTERDTWADKLSDAVTYSPDWVHIEKEGWLVKLSANVIKTLTRLRYFALRGSGALEYYESTRMKAFLRARVAIR